MAQADDPATAFWRWSLDRYARPGAQAALLQLQDVAGLDVNVALWCCRCAERYAPLPDAMLMQAMEMTRDFARDVTGPLRGARRALKAMTPSADIDALRETVKAAELEAERQAQLRLAALDRLMTPAPAGDDDETRGRARKNLAAYARLAGAPKRPGFSISLLEAAITAIFPPEQ